MEICDKIVSKILFEKTDIKFHLSPFFFIRRFKSAFIKTAHLFETREDPNLNPRQLTVVADSDNLIFVIPLFIKCIAEL
jgi:hypothetical protein